MYIINTIKPGADVFMFASLALNILLTNSNYSINTVF